MTGSGDLLHVKNLSGVIIEASKKHQGRLGAVLLNGGKDVFVPAASISASGLSRLKAGQRVSFELEPDAKGPKAVNVAPV